jgi:endonuclease YncB( thermonuclease family)
VVLVGGKTDLAEMLVRAGLARAFGQVVDAPKGKRMAGYLELEKTAKAGKVGLYGGKFTKDCDRSATGANLAQCWRHAGPWGGSY